MREAVIGRKICKSFGDVQVLQELSFDALRGECHGLLGPDGAGKTTLLSLIGCTSTLDAGQLKVLGMDVGRFAREIRGRLGVVPQRDTLDRGLNAIDNLAFYAGYFGLPRKEARSRAESLLQFTALEGAARQRIDELSVGLRRRLLLARGLINRPELLVLDEPTRGLDAQDRHAIWDRLRRLKSEGISMLLCTPLVEEARQLCDRVSPIDRGRLLTDGRPELLDDAFPPWADFCDLDGAEGLAGPEGVSDAIGARELRE
ncbi:MAG: ABC transporter ATP-binding protein [Deltaproteobacteria bacterium]|nr:ABC transporter ATP-binding protein [Deltaproteobacteria bacterium]